MGIQNERHTLFLTGVARIDFAKPRAESALPPDHIHADSDDNRLRSGEAGCLTTQRRRGILV